MVSGVLSIAQGWLCCKMAMDPFCEIAIEETARLKESGQASEVIVVSLGPQVSQEQLRTGMALGADRAR
jgi:electron transfer flavoprotein beta subunit